MPWAYKLQMTINELTFAIDNDETLLAARPFRVLFIFKDGEGVSYIVTNKDVIPPSDIAIINKYTHVMSSDELFNLWLEIDDYQTHGDHDLLGDPIKI